MAASIVQGGQRQGPDRNPDTLPTPQDLTGPCPRCGRVSNFQHEDNKLLVAGDLVAGTAQVLESSHVLRCKGCMEGLVVIMRDGAGVHWYPPPGAGLLDPAVNAEVASCFDEGMRCLSVGANRAAAVMFRSALHCFIKDKGSERAQKERHLKNALKHMKTDGDLHRSLWDWADELNQLGNEGAHPEDYDDVTDAEATALADFVRQLVKLEYEMGAQLARVRNRDQSAIAAEKAETPAAPKPEPPTLLP
ncbi:DUF4145 domain-containing protein [Kribbella sp. NPDC003557]|uniref:DUF4145 domain-containing protein n=1 Tax=Kribbella sp. NPDC003557 TaxID=3154449 RepID=UPI0033A3A167